MKFSGKVVLITGGTRGIGKSIALEFAREGATLALNYVNDDERAEENLKEIKEIGGYGILIKGDVSNYTFAGKMMEQVIKTLGKVDILVNNAAISKIGLFMDMEECDYNSVMDINFKSVYNTSHSVIKHMITNKRGNIINISSMWGNLGASCEVLYSSSKGAINSFTKSLAKELAPSNIRVNAVAPGVINTEMNAWLTKEEREELINEIPLGRLGNGEEVAKVVAFLASEDSSYVTGQIINVDGGLQ
ncbi:3-oxoacyl-[acyl-carrier-protein] reductase FabG [bioreactor metagenome]|uniref:3-oxoacyl-[acyl-carrier-protein] reductase FabG n=1 Tax=bioreactor metagenome TaxID=1076179 RepID=A0A645C953_9ZZZZ